jgi:polysaccharide export outer membrane protein
MGGDPTNVCRLVIPEKGEAISMSESKILRFSGVFIALSFFMIVEPLAKAQATASAEPRSAVSTEERQAPQSSPSSRATVSNYTIGPDDVLDIDVFNLPELAKTVRVSNDGTIVLALLGRIQVSGFTLDEVRRELESRYAKTYLQNPQVTVFVREFHSRPASVLGSVDKPGVYQITGNQTLVDMLSLAGGLSREKTTVGRSVFVTRKGGFGSIDIPEGMRLVSAEKIEINLSRLLYSRAGDLNILIKPNDIIAVNQADVFYVMGGVKQAAGFTFTSKDQVTVLQAVAMAGGLTSTASKGVARLIRTKEDGARTEIPVELGKILNGKSPDVRLAANDILYINDSTSKAALRRSVDAIVSTTSGLLIYRGFP